MCNVRGLHRKCLLQVFDTNFMSGSKYVVDDVTKKFKDRLMDPRVGLDYFK